MEKYIKGHANTDIKQIIGMQTLLDQYDRENRFLNKQVLQLLEENKYLKIDKIKQNLVTQLTGLQKIKKKSKSTKQEDLQLLKKLKEKKVEAKISKKTVEKKDESVQVTSFQKSSKDIQMSHNQLKKQNSDVFSFGSLTGRGSPEKKQDKVDFKESRRQSPTKKTKNNATSPEKNPTTDYKEPYKVQLLRSPIEQFQEHEKQKLQYSHDEKRVFYMMRDNNFSRESLEINKERKLFKSSHAIEPSPKIEPSKSNKNLLRQQSDHFIQRASSLSCFKSESIEKKKKFIDVISNKQKKFNWQRKGWEFCC